MEFQDYYQITHTCTCGKLHAVKVSVGDSGEEIIRAANKVHEIVAAIRAQVGDLFTVQSYMFNRESAPEVTVWDVEELTHVFH